MRAETTRAFGDLEYPAKFAPGVALPMTLQDLTPAPILTARVPGSATPTHRSLGIQQRPRYRRGSERAPSSRRSVPGWVAAIVTNRHTGTDFQLPHADQVEVDTFPADSSVVALHRYWQSIAPEPGILPGRQHLDPLDIDTAAMPWMFFMDVLREPDGSFDYLYRVVGTGNVALVGKDATGKRANDVFGRDHSAFVLGTFDQTVEAAVPTFWIGRAPHERFGDIVLHRALFPMAGDGRTVDMLLCIAAPWPAS